MRKNIAVTIAGQEYTLVASEEERYIRKVAAHVDEKVQEVQEGGKVSLINSTILAAINIADEYYKELESMENLRRQLKDALEEAAKLKSELSEAKREIFKLGNRK